MRNMGLSIEDKIAILMLHRDNLYKAATFEDYRNAHVAYVDFLIDEMGANKEIKDAIVKFANYGVTNEENSNG
jgi:hypothetical protein